MGPKYDRIASVLAYLKTTGRSACAWRTWPGRSSSPPPTSAAALRPAPGFPLSPTSTTWKVERAKELLLREGSVTQVSLELGYESLTHFERVFRQIAGLSPTEWRKSQRPGEDKIS